MYALQLVILYMYVWRFSLFLDSFYLHCNYNAGDSESKVKG